jgi:hypothetical protein
MYVILNFGCLLDGVVQKWGAERRRWYFSQVAMCVDRNALSNTYKNNTFSSTFMLLLKNILLFITVYAAQDKYHYHYAFC